MAQRSKDALVWQRLIADTETPVAAALKLIEPGRGDFLLESVEGGATRGRYSLLGLAPDLVFRANGTRPRSTATGCTDRDAFTPCEAATLEALRALVAECRADVCPKGCRRRSPASSAISPMRRSAWSRLCRARTQPARPARHAVRAADGDPGVRSAGGRLCSWSRRSGPRPWRPEPAWRARSSGSRRSRRSWRPAARATTPA
jgi:hypothetical protein